MIALETERLIIRNFAPDDWQALQELAIEYQASEWAKYEDPWPTSEEEVKGMAAWFAGGDSYLAVCLKETGKLIGMIAIERREEQAERVHNLGYVFHPGYAGHGYATESCCAAMGYLFGRLEADGILTGTHPDNKPSVALLKRLGLREIGRGEWTLSRAEWLARERRYTMEPKIFNRETITVLGVQARLAHMEEGVPEMWEVRFMAYHDQIAPLSTDGVYYGCAFATDRPELYDYLAGMALPASTAVPEGLTLREIPGGLYVMVECTIATQDDAFDLVEHKWLSASAYQKDQSRPTLDCYPPGLTSTDSPMYLCFPIVDKPERGYLLNETMAKQARQAFKTLRTAIQNCPDGLWKAGSGSYLVIARLAFHALQAIDYHLDQNPGRFDWNEHGIDWEGSDVSQLWDRARTLDYLEEMLAKTLAFVNDPVGLLSEDVKPESCLSRLDHLCYALRHLTQHTGEINALLRQANATVGYWL